MVVVVVPQDTTTTITTAALEPDANLKNMTPVVMRLPTVAARPRPDPRSLVAMLVSHQFRLPPLRHHQQLRSKTFWVTLVMMISALLSLPRPLLQLPLLLPNHFPSMVRNPAYSRLFVGLRLLS